jgi:hypothetical protein
VNEAIAIIVLFGVVSLIGWLLFYYKPVFKPRRNYGEIKVSSKLKRLSLKHYRVINDVLIQSGSRSSQIDHIVISNYGIFVIETKHFKGWIFGHDGSDYWTQTLYSKRHHFRNPVIQCWGHIKTLKSVLSEFHAIQYFPLIVFSGNADLKKITSEVPVLYAHQLVRHIKKCSTSECLSDKEADEIYEKLDSLNKADRDSRESHVRKAKANQQKGEKSQTCPRCGARLTLKHGKYGMFYGCSSYPGCGFTKNI